MKRTPEKPPQHTPAAAQTTRLQGLGMKAAQNPAAVPVISPAGIMVLKSTTMLRSMKNGDVKNIVNPVRGPYFIPIAIAKVKAKLQARKSFRG